MSLEAACKPSSVPRPIRIGLMDGHPSVRPTRELSEPPAAARRPPCAPLFGLAPARACPFHSRSRGSGHRHCDAGPRLTADGCYPLACSEELGLSSDAAFRPMRPRPSSRLQGDHCTRLEHPFGSRTGRTVRIDTRRALRVVSSLRNVSIHGSRELGRSNRAQGRVVIAWCESGPFVATVARGLRRDSGHRSPRCSADRHPCSARAGRARRCTPRTSAGASSLPRGSA